MRVERKRDMAKYLWESGMKREDLTLSPWLKIYRKCKRRPLLVVVNEGRPGYLVVVVLKECKKVRFFHHDLHFDGRQDVKEVELGEKTPFHMGYKSFYLHPHGLS